MSRAAEVATLGWTCPRLGVPLHFELVADAQARREAPCPVCHDDHWDNAVALLGDAVKGRRVVLKVGSLA